MLGVEDASDMKNGVENKAARKTVQENETACKTVRENKAARKTAQENKAARSAQKPCNANDMQTMLPKFKRTYLGNLMPDLKSDWSMLKNALPGSPR